MSNSEGTQGRPQATDKGPSAASLETARRAFYTGKGLAAGDMDERHVIDAFALALDAAIQGARKEALGQAADVADNARVIHFAETMGDNEASRTAQRLAAAIRALMEAE